MQCISTCLLEIKSMAFPCLLLSKEKKCAWYCHMSFVKGNERTSHFHAFSVVVKKEQSVSMYLLLSVGTKGAEHFHIYLVIRN